MKLRPGRRALSAAIVLSTGCFAHQYRHNPRIAIVDGDPIVPIRQPPPQVWRGRAEHGDGALLAGGGQERVPVSLP